MFKATKKFWSMADALDDAASGGGGSPTNIFTPSASPLNADDTNSNLSFRVICTASVNSLGKLKVKFASRSNLGLQVSRASIAKWDGTAAAVATTAPVELKFSAASGFNIAANSFITSDACNHSAAFSIATGDGIMVIFDIASGANGGQRIRASLTNADTWYSNPGQVSWNVQTPTGPMGFAKLAGTDYAIELIDTES